jgi:hypothetical protein
LNNTLLLLFLLSAAGMMLVAVASVVYWRRFILLAAIFSVSILRWCYAKWGRANQAAMPLIGDAVPA